MAFVDKTFRFGAHAVIVNAAGQVLMLKKTYGDFGWSLPGGGVDPGETIHQAVYRECREELGVEVRDALLTGVYYHSKMNVQAALFRCTLPEQAEITLSREHSAYRWAELSDMSEVQRIRVKDALDYAGAAVSRAF